MTRGKYAARSAQKAQRTVDEHIDRLTDQLVEAKARAKQFEHDAQLVPALQGRIEELERRIDEDVAVQELVEAFRADHELVLELDRRFIAYRDAFMFIAKRYNQSVLHMPGSNYVEWLKKRFGPDLFTYGDKRCDIHSTPTAKRLSDEALYRLQAFGGHRWVDHDGTPLVGIERMDGKELIHQIEALDDDEVGVE